MPSYYDIDWTMISLTMLLLTSWADACCLSNIGLKSSWINWCHLELTSAASKTPLKVICSLHCISINKINNINMQCKCQLQWIRHIKWYILHDRRKHRSSKTVQHTRWNGMKTRFHFCSIFLEKPLRHWVQFRNYHFLPCERIDLRQDPTRRQWSTITIIIIIIIINHW